MAVTLGQISEQLGDMRGELVEVNRKLDKVTEQALDRRVTALEDTVSWISRLVIGGVITASIGGISGLIFALVR